MGIIRGLYHARERSISIIDIYSDSVEAVKLITEGVGDFHLFHGTVKKVERVRKFREMRLLSHS